MKPRPSHLHRSPQGKKYPMTDSRLREALGGLVEIIDKAGLRNLRNGVQLGATSWYVKAYDRLEYARAALSEAGEGVPFTVEFNPDVPNGEYWINHAGCTAKIKIEHIQDQGSGPVGGGGGREKPSTDDALAGFDHSGRINGEIPDQPEAAHGAGAAPQQADDLPAPTVCARCNGAEAVGPLPAPPVSQTQKEEGW